jgi:membrane protease YdiL (CAAX protease family)
MSGMRGIFWNARQRRLRAGWRLLIQFALFVTTLLGVGAVAGALGPGDEAAVVGSTLYLALGLGLAWLLARFLDRRPLADYGFHLSGGWWLDLGFGLLLGALLMTGVFLAESLAGWASVTPAAAGDSGLAAGSAFLVSLCVCLAGGLNEELTFRGYQLRNLAEGLCGRRLGPRPALVLALVLSSALFGGAHLTNPNATALSTLYIVLGGLLLSLPYLLTGELAIPIGLHASWNLFEGTVYGFPVSGNVPTRRLLAVRQGGPELWTGGAFGPEAGLLAVVWMVLGCALIALWVRWRRRRLSLYLPLARYEAFTSCKPL